MQVGETYGVASLNTALTMLIGKNLALMVSPLVPATYLAIGLTGTELKGSYEIQHSALLCGKPDHVSTGSNFRDHKFIRDSKTIKA